MGLISCVMTSEEPGWILGTKKLKKYYLWHKHALSQVITSVWEIACHPRRETVSTYQNISKMFAEKRGKKVS